MTQLGISEFSPRLNPGKNFPQSAAEVIELQLRKVVAWHPANPHLETPSSFIDPGKALVIGVTVLFAGLGIRVF